MSARLLSKLAIAFGIAVAAIVPLILPSWATLVTLILAKGIVVLGIIILLQAGQVSFGHAMFYGVGAYTVAFWERYVGAADLLLFLLLGPLIAMAFGLLIGLFVVRYREIFFGMLNLAFSMVMWSLLEKLYHYTNGADGIRVARPTLAGIAFTPEAFQYVLLYLTLGLVLVVGGETAASWRMFGAAIVQTTAPAFAVLPL